MRDDIEFNIEFCELIEKYPALYDHSRSDYCNRNVQDKLWQEIGNRLNETAKDCKDRWQNIRGRYGKFKKAKSLPSGSEAKTVKDYYLAPYLQFLDVFIKSRKPKSNLKRDVEKNQNLDDSDYEPETAFSPSASRSESELGSAGFPIPSPSSTGSITTRTPTLKDLNRTAYQYFTERKNQEKTTSLPDSDLSFLQSVLPDMKLMSPDQNRRFKIGVLNLAGRILEEKSPVDSNVQPFTSHNQQAANQYQGGGAPHASGYQNTGSSSSSTQHAEIQHQNLTQYTYSYASGHENPGTRTQHQPQYASPVAEYQNPAGTNPSLPPYSPISPASASSRLQFNERTAESLLGDDYC